MPVREWDGSSYDRISAPMEALGLEVLARLELRGDEVVLDAGCGSGRVTEALIARLPHGRVIAVDASASMVAAAAARLGGRAEVRQMDLLELEVAEPVDAILSTATFHWIADHDRLYARLHQALAPGGRLAAQCGGLGNVAGLHAAAATVGEEEPYRAYLADWKGPWNFTSAEQAQRSLSEAGFTDVRCWLVPVPVHPPEPVEYMRTIVLGAHLERLPTEMGEQFVADVIEQLGTPLTIDYVRLNIDARAPAA